MIRHLAFFVVGVAFTVGVVGMVETHSQGPNGTPQVVVHQSAH